MAHDARIIPLFKTAEEAKAHHRPAALRPWMGDSVGWWEADTLVVETMHPNPEGGGAARLSADGKITERFTRVSARELLYVFTVDDPTYYTQPWTGETHLFRTDDQLLEYACHEANYSLPWILRAARLKDSQN